MNRSLSDHDHALLRQFIADTRVRMSALESAVNSVHASHSAAYQHETMLAIPVATIEPATFASNVWTVTPGDAYFVTFSTATGQKYSRAAASRGKLKLTNLHRGMWLWSGVMYPVFRDANSQRLVAANLGINHQLRGVTTATIAAGATGPVLVLSNGSSFRTLTGVKHDHMEGTTGLANGTEVIVTWFDDDNAWHITEAAC